MKQDYTINLGSKQTVMRMKCENGRNRHGTGQKGSGQRSGQSGSGKGSGLEVGKLRKGEGKA